MQGELFIETCLIIGGSLILLTLGCMHLFYTFFTDKFSTRNPETEIRMREDVPVLTRQTTLWKAWIGFNASHSLGAMFFGLINIFIASQHFELYQESLILLLLDDCTILFYLFLAKKYWFKIPLLGIAIAFLCFMISTMLILLT